MIVLPNDFNIMAAMGLAWGYNPQKSTPHRSAEEEVAAFEKHAGRGIRHYFLSKLINYTAPVMLFVPVFLGLIYYAKMGLIGAILGSAIGLALLYGYARLAWRLFRK